MIRIFLADDHAVIRDGLRFLLDAQPDLVVIGDTDNGRDAVRLVQETKPDLVILDIGMPELNGIDAAQRIREHCPDTKIIMLSMHATNSHIHRALQAGARGYLLKASAGVEVADAVRAVHAGKRYLSQEISDQVITEYLNQREFSEAQSPLSSLSTREREILQLVVEGNSSAEIGRILSISPKTVDTYRSRLMQKLNMSDIPSLVKFAIQHGLTSLE